MDGFKHNLISISQICDKIISILFSLLFTLLLVVIQAQQYLQEIDMLMFTP